jgi:hypothetical protein
VLIINEEGEHEHEALSVAPDGERELTRATWWALRHGDYRPGSLQRS